jgi:hypothetical protein
MRPGGGKQKGSAFEREVCTKLSLWLTNGKNKDVLWRSAMSGGRATVGRGQVRQCGDICSVSEEGHVLTNSYYIECKHYHDLQFNSFVLHGKGCLAKFWQTAKTEARKYGLHPVLIAKGNHFPAIVITGPGGDFNLNSVAIVRGARIGLFARVLQEDVGAFMIRSAK